MLQLQTFWDNPIYIEELALNYLLDTGILNRVAREIVIHISPGAFARMQDLIRKEYAEEELVEAIDKIRHVISQAVSNGKASFLPFCLDGMEQQSPVE